MTTIARVTKRGLPMTLPAVDIFRWAAGRGGFTLQTEKEKQAMKTLFQEIEKLKPYDNEGAYEFWIEVPRGTIEDYGDYKEMLEEEEVQSYEEYLQRWTCEYPEKSKWYHIVAIHRNSYMGLFIQNRLLFEFNPNVDENFFLNMEEETTFFLSWLTLEVKQCIQKLKDGTYNEDLRENLGVNCRTGTILYQDYWRVYPQEKERIFEGMSEEDFREFTSYETRELENTDQRLKTMTAQQFFDACAFGYKECNYDTKNQSSVEQYFHFADGRDDGLSQIDLTSPEEFDSWYRGDRPNRNGGHPYEVCRGGNSTHVDLYIEHDDRGYYFCVAGLAWTRSVEAIHFYMALRRAGLPVVLYKGELLKKRLCGTLKIGIVPEGVYPSYCSSYFPKEDVVDYMNLDDYEEDNAKLLPYIQWQELPTVQLNEIN